MNCLDCYKLDWEIEKGKEKSEWGWGKIVLGVVLGASLMLVSWIFAIKYYNSLMIRPREIVLGEHSWIERDGQLISWYSFEKARGLNFKENVTDMQLWKREIEEISGKKASVITFEKYLRDREIPDEEAEIIEGWGRRINDL